MKHRNLSIYNELKEIKPLDDTAAIDTTLQQARDIKTQKVKQFAYIGILEQCFQNYLNTFCKNIF